MGCQWGGPVVTGITALMVGVGGLSSGTVSLSNSNVYNGGIAPANALASYSLNPSGQIVATGQPTTFWVAPQVGMELFEVRATLNSGALSAGTTGTWLALNSIREWACAQTEVQGIQSANLTIQIRRIGDSTILASATVTITAEVFSL